MNFFIVLTLAVADASAFYLSESKIEPHNFVVPEGRITNGEDASPGQFPYQVGLLLSRNNFEQFTCGGSLISDEWVLTAAHCTENIKNVIVYLGATDHHDVEIKYTVYKDDIIIHPEWDSRRARNDISLIKIPSTPFSARIRPVDLPEISKSFRSYVGDDAIISGWGRTSDFENTAAQTLQYAVVSVVNNNACSLAFGNIIQSSHICIATVGGVSTCNGDSGGPMVLASTGLQIGLTSFGPSAGCTLGKPAVFTRITSYLDWIHEHINGTN